MLGSGSAAVCSSHAELAALVESEDALALGLEGRHVWCMLVARCKQASTRSSVLPVLGRLYMVYCKNCVVASSREHSVPMSVLLCFCCR